MKTIRLKWLYLISNFKYLVSNVSWIFKIVINPHSGQIKHFIKHYCQARVEQGGDVVTNVLVVPFYLEFLTNFNILQTNVDLLMVKLCFEGPHKFTILISSTLCVTVVHLRNISSPSNLPIEVDISRDP